MTWGQFSVLSLVYHKQSINFNHKNDYLWTSIASSPTTYSFSLTVSQDTFSKLQLITKNYPAYSTLFLLKFFWLDIKTQSAHYHYCPPLLCPPPLKGVAIKHLLKISHSHSDVFHNYRPVSNFPFESPEKENSSRPIKWLYIQQRPLRMIWTQVCL